ncbi:hypothetical protein L596_026429 [Steinernema carpocapsae]|uniref:C3H1-type domain-containing protein n=1 Tax=Steinernema carpocapsae TaxID=34508 RepID=A0A4U5M1C2_STECR|nr:hypothetical protein L596_026429 [Steinernema carpocapsae]
MRNFRTNHPPAGVPRNPSLYKTSLCDYWLSGHECRFGERCWYAHGPQEIRQSPGSGGGHQRRNTISWFEGSSSSGSSGEMLDSNNNDVAVDPAVWNQNPLDVPYRPWMPPPPIPAAYRSAELDRQEEEMCRAVLKEAEELVKMPEPGSNMTDFADLFKPTTVDKDMFRTLMAEAEELLKTPEQIPNMDSFFDLFKSTTIDAPFKEAAANKAHRTHTAVGNEELLEAVNIWANMEVEGFEEPLW